MKIFIDTGHCRPPKDRGAIGYLNEEDVSIEVAQNLGSILKTRNCEVAFSNATDGSSVRASLSQRCAQANQFDPDLFVSLHCNASSKTADPMGTEVFAASTKGEAFASRVERNITKLGFKSRGVKAGSHLYVIRNTEAPAILVELFFIDSQADCHLYERVGAKDVALAIADAICLPTAKISVPVMASSIAQASQNQNRGDVVRSGYLTDAAKYFSSQTHQIAAWAYLQSQVPDSVLIKFRDDYSPKQVSAKESIRPKFDSSNIDWSNPNCPISDFFTVVEVTKGDPARTPTIGSQEEKNILALAIELDKLRKAFGHPLGVTSWYRPPAINKAVGGVPDSQHIDGLAADVYPLSGMDIDNFQAWCDSVWFGALGRGARKGFVHLDTRNGKGYLSGGDKGSRWNY